MNKRGDLGSFIVNFVSIIIIIIIIIIFIMGSGVVKKISETNRDVSIYGESDVEVDDVFIYMEEYSDLTKIKFYLQRGNNLSVSLQEGGYYG